jgi:hypothetical protein
VWDYAPKYESFAFNESMKGDRMTLSNNFKTVTKTGSPQGTTLMMNCLTRGHHIWKIRIDKIANYLTIGCATTAFSLNGLTPSSKGQEFWGYDF